MNVKTLIDQLEKQYPGKAIICLPKDNPTEILCEIDPSSLHPDYSVAISVIDKSSAHVHKITVEEYEVLKGSLTLYKDDKKYNLKEGESITIQPNEVHYAIGDETWIKATSHPGWTAGDHLLQEDTRNFNKAL